MVQRFAVGAEDTVVPFDEPQVPFVAVGVVGVVANDAFTEYA